MNIVQCPGDRAPSSIMNNSLLKHAFGLVVIFALSLGQGFAAPQLNKTLRVDHGRPLVVVSQKSVLVLEFIKESIADALVAHPEPDFRHCRARYRYQFYDGATGSVTNGQGTVEEIYQSIPGTGGTQIKDMGSRVGISAGDFYLWWSQGSAGARSWVYYRAESPIRFVQQPQQLAFESLNREQLQRYLASRNVEEYVSAGRTVQVTGPAVFAGDWPTDKPASGRVESGRVRDGTFELKLTGLAMNQHYLIESSYEARSGTWAPVHTFVASESAHAWSEFLGKDVNVMFYRIRQGAY